MPPVIKQITSWSYSRYHDYVTCPLKAKLKHLDRIQEPPNAAMARGSAIGKMVENYLKGKVVKLDEEAEKYRPDFKNAVKLFKKDLEEAKKNVAKRTVTTIVEDNWAFTRAYLRTTWDNWKECWLRVKLDYAFSIDGENLYIVDWKTGKFRPEQNHDYIEQLELYALAGLYLYPNIKAVYPTLKYLDLGRTYPDAAYGEKVLKFTRADLPELTKVWEKRVKPMLADKRFAPKPNRFCGFCHYRAQNKFPDPNNLTRQPGGGGQCRF